MLKKTSILLFLTISTAVFSQQFYMESSLSTAYFENYRDDQGIANLDNKYSKPIELGFGFGAIFHVKNERLFWDLGLSYNKYKINTSFTVDNTSTDTSYDLSYLNLKTGAIYTLFDVPRLKFQVHGHVSNDRFLQGTNRYLDVFIDLSRSEQFDTSLLNYHYGFAIEYELTSAIAFYLSCDIKRSLESNGNINDETYRLNVRSIQTGLRFQL